MPRRGTLRIAVRTSSKAAAKDLMTELRFLRKRLVMIPRTALLRMMRRTRLCMMEPRASEVKALANSDCKKKYQVLLRCFTPVLTRT